jgi:beta-N-acetylhexosaminidase
MKGLFCFATLLLLHFFVLAQRHSQLPAQQWVDSVFKTLGKDEKIAQLMVIRSSTISNGKPQFLDAEVETLIRTYNVGGLCLFQGGAVQHAQRINYFQSIAKTPLLMTVDGEWGLGMRFDSVQSLPRQMMLGAVQDATLVYNYGKLIAEQCKRIGLQVNYAPVVDINNNPNNPVINDRSFGEDKYKVALFGLQYMKGLQENGIMASAKHFPGHGDVAVDSHHDLPLISKTKQQLDSLELFPFKELINGGVGSVMVAHLSIPVIDNSPNRPTSISYKNVTELLRKELGFTGLTFTDALEMKGVTKYFPDGAASLEAILAGHDMLCLPGDVPAAITKVKAAIKKKKLTWADIDNRVKRILLAKYQYGLAQLKTVDTYNLVKDLNAGVPALTKEIAENAITVVRNNEPLAFPLPVNTNKRIAYVGIGLKNDNAFAKRIRDDYNANTFYFDYSMNEAKANAILELLKDSYDIVVIGLHNYNRRPANNFNISNTAVYLTQQLQQRFKTITFAFGNPYAIKNFCNAKTIIACYEDNAIIQTTAADLLNGRFAAKGKLPVTVCEELPYGTGLVTARLMPSVAPAAVNMKAASFKEMDAIIEEAIQKKAFPGGVLLVTKNGKIVHEKAYGHLTYDSTQPMYTSTLFDMASVTKIMATNISVMKLYEEGKLSLDKTLGDYLPWVKGSNKEGLIIRDILLHQAGLKAFIPFNRETIDTNRGGVPSATFYSYTKDSVYSIPVANNMFLRKDWNDTMYQRILKSELGPVGKYIYSDNDFIFLGKIVEAISGKPLNIYAKENFYDPLQLTGTTFKPKEIYPLNYIAPTEEELGFRQQLIWGFVHDPGAAMFGGVAGHAGLFSNAYDMAVLGQLLLNGGNFNGRQYLKKETIDMFTAYGTNNSRRGLGFDKPEKDNATRKEPYPCLSVSPQTFGHTGFTGTCVWMDPANELCFVLLTNRVHPDGANRLSQLNVRARVHELVYKAMAQ